MVIQLWSSLNFKFLDEKERNAPAVELLAPETMDLK